MENLEKFSYYENTQNKINCLSVMVVNMDCAQAFTVI